MFWRRSKRAEGRAGGADAADGLDDMAKLQRQFGIKPVSDADVQGEFQKLFGGSSGDVDSPTAQLMRLIGGDGGGGDDDEEARILRELNVGDSFNLDDVDVPSDDEAGDHAGDMVHVIAEAQRNHERQTTAIGSGDAHAIASSFSGHSGEGNAASATPEQVRELKMRALQLKREGNMPAALAMLREAKQLEANMSSMQAGTVSSINAERVGTAPATETIPAVSSARVAVTTASSISRATAVNSQHPAANGKLHHDNEEEDDVEVTEDDMQDPEFLAQLAGFGLVEDSDDRKADSELASRIAALETQIQELKLKALRLKRENQIQKALVCMRSMRELEKQRDELQVTQPSLAPVQAQALYAVDRAPQMNTILVETSVRTAVSVVHGYAAPASQDDGHPQYGDDDSDIDVTEDDMNDPSFQDELAKLGFSDGDNHVNDVMTVTTETQPSASAQPTTSVSTALPKTAPRLYTFESFDEDGLIDEFESESDEDASDSENTKAEIEPPSFQSLEIESSARTAEPPANRASHTPVGSSVADLQSQLDRARHMALQFKRDGKLNEALESLRRAKQIENLIQLKQTAGPDRNQPAPVRDPPQDPRFASKFQELEGLLVEFGNCAMTLAKENLSSDRVAAAAWLAKRKQYAAQLDKLREKRQDPLQPPPHFTVTKTSRQVEFELPQIPNDCIRVEIKSVNGLAQAAGGDVYIQFSLNFPATTPHEAQTDVFRIQPGAPHSSGPLNPSKAFQFKLQRTRGTLRLFEIKKATFEVWRPGTLFRNPELVARGYQSLSSLLSKCEVVARVPFVGSNRKPTGGDVEIALQVRRPLRDKEIREEVTDELVVGDYPDPVRGRSTESFPQMPTVTQQSVLAPLEHASPTITQEEKTPVSEELVPKTLSGELDPFDLELIVSYDVINEELEKIEAKLGSMSVIQASELRDRQDSLALKKQLLEIEMQTGKLTLEAYTARLHQCIAADRKLMADLMRLGRRPDAARVLRRVKIMEKELEGAEGGEEE